LWIQKLFYAEVKIQRFFYKRWIHVDSCWSRLYNHGESVLKQFFFQVGKHGNELAVVLVTRI
jgi:hypothetical protein